MNRLGWFVIICAWIGCDALPFEAGYLTTKLNPKYCDQEVNPCQAGEVCNFQTNACQQSTGTCSPDTGIGCTQDTAPVCSGDSRCIGCDTMNAATGDGQCQKWASDQKNQKKICLAGVCKECRTNSDCKEPGKAFCDQLRNTCVGCTDDVQCPVSNFCKKDDSSLATNDSTSNIGDCVAPDAVAYVNKTNGSCSDTAMDAGGATKPFCQISKAILMSGKSYIRVQGGIEYESIVVDQSKRVVIYGPGKTMSSVLSARVTAGARLTLQDIAVSAAIMSPSTGALIQCDMAYLTVRRSLLTGRGASQGGILANQCPRVIVERTKFDQINGNGLFIAGGSAHFVVNNAIIRSGSPFLSMADRFGLRIGQGVTGSTFAFNTLIQNQAGVFCETTATGITDSIVQDNAGMQQIMGCTIITNVVTSGAVIDMTSGNDPMITMETANVVNKATTNPMVKEDYFGTPRPMGGAYDIGFHEYK